MRPLFPAVLALALPLAWGGTAAAQPVDYLRQVKPVLAAHCYACHGALQQKAGLRTDTARSLREGGGRGPALVPGNSGASPVIAHVTGRNGARPMPPPGLGEALSEKEVALLRAWIDQGAAAPADERPEPDPREHWAFHAPVRPAVPAVKDAARARNPVDAFLAAEWERRGLTPQPPADRRLLLRRVYLDLVGLPPTPEDLAAFVADSSPDAYEKVVDRLLDSPRYGERWGRHWMDVWRYSDWWGLGAEVRNSQKHLWHWRDWIVESVNADKGYDQMLREMLAADELYPNDLDRLRATGFLARSYFKFNRNSWLEEVVEHTSKAFLGLTMNCARCHDHKFDPISQRDYSSFRAFFEPYQVRTDELPGETDLEKDGLPRAFDCNLDAPTYRFERGDERRPLKDHAVAPALPALLALGRLQVEPVALPPEAHAPGLRPWVLEDQLRAAERQAATARAALGQARHELAELEETERRTVVVAHKPVEGKPLVPDNPGAASAKLLSVANLRLSVARAEKALAAAEAQPVALRARAAADRARLQPPDPTAKELARQAARAERQAAVAKAEEDVARAELAVAIKEATADQKLAAARDALAKARQALDAAGDVYTPLRGSLKTPESNLETEESRLKPFPATSSGRRSALARWLTDPGHPLTARVAVNHVWARHFGTPLVPTVFDFGRKGTPPTHPALLDYLATELVEHGWSMKYLHRLLVTSNAYRLSSSAAGAAPATLAADPENRCSWRMNPVRMEAEAVRDSLLHLAGDLDPRVGGPPVPVDEDSRRRSLYFVHSHNDENRFLSTFDEASVLECYRRSESIVPQQALALSNSKLTLAAAARINARLGRQLGDATDARFARAAFEAILCDTPTRAEQAACERALADWTTLLRQRRDPDPVCRARADLVHALLNHNDFITIR
jgi:mono/diheme cytochrome c family protein